MKLYHGSTYIIKEPTLEILNYKTDFGKGFYTTTDFEQAERWAITKSERLPLKEDVHKYVNVFEFEDNSDLNILNFEEATKEWLEFVYMNRKCERLEHNYDIIKGPVADDRLYKVLSGYEDGTYDVDETIKRLKTYVLANQISFHTEEAISLLRYIETIEVGDINE